MNEPQLVMSEQINNNSGNTLRHGMSDALIFAKLVFELPRGAGRLCLGEAGMFLWVGNSCASEGAITGDLGFSPALLVPDVARPAQGRHLTFRLIVSNNFSND